MIVIDNIRRVQPNQFDEVWAIVRSAKKLSPWITHKPDLSPSSRLFQDYLYNWKSSGKWGPDMFATQYVPRFINQIAHDPNAIQLLNELWQKDRMGKKIALVCFCPDPRTCHRSIIAGILQGTGVNVITPENQDYSAYYDQFLKNQNQ